MYRISEVSDQLGISIPTIRYYEKIGLIDTPIKDRNGYRKYDEDIIQYLRFIINLKETDMSLEMIKKYVDAYKNKDHHTCFIILKDHAEKMQLEIEKRQQILGKVQYKIAHFSELKGGGK
ncbi:MerR family transcriptional regulator [Sutcliffiella halmapala]|uniref:MerR family transcriptional regulator n=1 Tax=Sutcliffiella halmapala TaxID=79882 RepID=UPI0009956356|nr:MerR family transcriptional regulator [Sutcliffiella halmapala]